MRKAYIAGNWKMNMAPSEGRAYAAALLEAVKKSGADVKMMVAPPFVTIPAVLEVLKDSPIIVAAQNMADHDKGAYTGEVSPLFLKDLGVNTVILGHSERRQYYGETNEIINAKIHLALSHSMDVIYCIGETLEERENGKLEEVLSAQLSVGLKDVKAEDMSHIVIAYEPVWAIGTGKTATADQAEEMHAFIRATIAEKFGAEAAENVSILYGGSCKPSNAKEIFAKPDVDGGLIGGAALKCADFKGIIDAWK